MVEVKLSRIIIDEQKKEQVVVLKEVASERLLPIVIGMNEASAIRMHLSGFVSPRPLTHDLMRSFIDVLGAKLEKVIIDNLVGGTFHAKLYLALKDKDMRIVDARPSDSIALALRTKSPMFVEEQVFEKLAEGI